MATGSRGTFESDYARKQCQKAAGPYFEELLHSYEATVERLKHSDPRARLGALFMLRDYWKPPPDFAQMCATLLSQDDDPQVRGFAIVCLSSCYYGTHDSAIGRRFAGIVRDEAQPVVCRRVAYCSLFSVRGMYDSPKHTFRFPEDVDWKFVDGFLEHKEPLSEAEKVALQFPFLNEQARMGIACRKEAEGAIKTGNLEEALVRLTESIKHEPLAYTFIERGNVYLQLERATEAVIDFTRALQILSTLEQPSPLAYKAYLGRARAHEKEGLDEQAQSDYKKALELTPSQANLGGSKEW